MDSAVASGAIVAVDFKPKKPLKMDYLERFTLNSNTVGCFVAAAGRSKNHSG